MGKSKEPIFYEKTKTQSKLPLFHISIFLAVRQKFLDLCACFVNNGLRFGSVWNCLFPFPGCHELQEIVARASFATLQALPNDSFAISVSHNFAATRPITTWESEVTDFFF